MTIVLAILIVAVLAALFFIRVSRGHAEAISNLDQLSGRTQPVDLHAFRNLIDPQETAFLRSNLPARAFHRLRRQRTKAAAEYVERIAQNAAVLLRLGQAVSRDPDPEVARVAQAMVERALAVRIIAMQALVKLRLQALLPGIEISNVSERYGRLTEAVALFTRLQRPTYTSHVLAML